MPSIRAVSATEYPSTSTSTIGTRCSSDSSDSAFCTTSLVSRSDIASRFVVGSPGPVSGSGTVYRLAGPTPNTCAPPPPVVVTPLTPSVVGIRAVKA